MEQAIMSLSDFGLLGLMLALCLGAIGWGVRWFVSKYLVDLKKQREAETAAIIAQSVALQASFTLKLDQLIAQSAAAAQTQSKNERAIAEGLGKLRESVQAGFHQLEMKVLNIDKEVGEIKTRVTKLENKQ